MDIQRDRSYSTDWLGWLWTCFGTRNCGPHVLVWLAVRQSDPQQSQVVPFLEATGEAGAGKTTLLNFLWKLLARATMKALTPPSPRRPAAPAPWGRFPACPSCCWKPTAATAAIRRTPSHSSGTN
jgi:hypothetical protein